MSPYRHRLRTQALAAALLLAVSTAAPARPKTPAKATATPHVTHAGKPAPRHAEARTGSRPAAHASARSTARKPAPGRHAVATRRTKPAATASTSLGKATVYSRRLSGRHTASGERFDPEAMTAAHRTLPLGTTVRVTRLDTGHSVVVTINDRGVGFRGRIIDLSPAAARRIGMRSGAARVSVEPIGRG